MVGPAGRIAVGYGGLVFRILLRGEAPSRLPPFTCNSRFCHISYQEPDEATGPQGSHCLRRRAEFTFRSLVFRVLGYPTFVCSGYRIRTVSRTHSVEPSKVGLQSESRRPKLLKSQETGWNSEKPWKGSRLLLSDRSAVRICPSLPHSKFLPANSDLLSTTSECDRRQVIQSPRNRNHSGI